MRTKGFSIPKVLIISICLNAMLFYLVLSDCIGNDLSRYDGFD